MIEEIHVTAVVDEQGDLDLHLHTDLEPGQYELILRVEEELALGRNGAREELPRVSVGGVLPGFSLHREDIYRDFGR